MIRKFLVSFATLCAVALSASASDEDRIGVVGVASTPGLSLHTLTEADVEPLIEAHNSWKVEPGRVGLGYESDEKFRATLNNQLTRIGTGNSWHARVAKDESGTIQGYFLFGMMPKTGYAEAHPVIQEFMDRLSIAEGYGLAHFAAEVSPSLLANPVSLEQVYLEATELSRRLALEKATLPRGAGLPHSLFLVYNEARVQEIELLERLGYTAHRNDAFKGFYDYPAVVLTLPLTEASE